MEKYYHIAGINLKMDTFGRTEKQAEKYRISPPAYIDAEVISPWPQLKNSYPDVPEDDGEYMSTGAAFYKALMDFDGFALHSSAVVVDGRAYLFSADSGTGKSTHTQLWLEHFKDKAYILNDDKPALRLVDDAWYAYGTPWSGKYDISVNTGVPIAGIAMLERAEDNSITPLAGKDAIQRILAQVNRVKSSAYRMKTLELLDRLLIMVPVWKLRCNMDISSAILAYETMSGQSADTSL